MLKTAVMATVKILQYINQFCDKELLRVICVEKEYCDDCDKSTIHRENYTLEFLDVICVDKNCYDDSEDTTIQRENYDK